MSYQSPKNPTADIVYFFDGHFPEAALEKEMTLVEFEAMLNDQVSMKAFSETIKYCVYVQFNQEALISACVFFLLEFDSNGLPPQNWSIPFGQLCESAGKGPNLGLGPIRLTCSSQCSIPWHQAKLWDFDHFPNVFFELQERVKKTLLHVQFEASRVQETLMDDDYEVGDVFNEQSYSRESPFEHLEIQDTFTANPAAKKPMTKPPSLASIMAQTSNSSSAGYTQPDKQAKVEAVKRQLSDKIAGLEQDHNDRLQSIKQEYELQLLSLTSEHEGSLDEISHELAQLQAKLRLLMNQNQSLEEINASQKKQIATLEEKIGMIQQQAAFKEKQDMKEVTQKYESLYSKRLIEQKEKLEAVIEQKETDLITAQNAIKQLQKDVTELRRDKIRLLNSGADKFFEKIEGLGISFIAFHAGAGHLSISLSDMTRYMENPSAYAAERCSVDEAHYLHWLSHYENPICSFQIGKDEICGCKIKKVENPKDFLPGGSDRCEKHQSAFAGIKGVETRLRPSTEQSAAGSK